MHRCTFKAKTQILIKTICQKTKMSCTVMRLMCLGFRIFFCLSQKGINHILSTYTNKMYWLFAGPPTSDDKSSADQSSQKTVQQSVQSKPHLVAESKPSNTINLNTTTTITRNAVRSHNNHHRLVTTKQHAASTSSAAAINSTITTNSRSQQVVAIREISKTGQTMIPISQHQSSTTSTTSIPHQNTSVLQQQLGIQSHGNIILVRGSRNENGQIILQNSHELLSLLNDSDDKPILLQNSRFKTNNSTGTKILHQQPDGTIVLQPGTTLKTTGSLDGNGSHHVLLQSGAVKKSNSLPEGSIIVQQRMNKSNGNIVNHDGGPILLQTLKRLDKSQSILVFRNSGSSAAATATTVSVTGGMAASSAAGRLKSLIVSPASVEEESVDKKEKKANVVQVSRSMHIPLGAGEYPFLF